MLFYIQVNGIRLVDKSTVGRKVIYRLELWINKDYPADQINTFKAKISKEFGCDTIQCKNIEEKK